MAKKRATRKRAKKGLSRAVRRVLKDQPPARRKKSPGVIEEERIAAKGRAMLDMMRDVGDRPVDLNLVDELREELIAGCRRLLKSRKNDDVARGARLVKGIQTELTQTRGEEMVMLGQVIEGHAEEEVAARAKEASAAQQQVGGAMHSCEDLNEALERSERE